MASSEKDCWRLLGDLMRLLDDEAFAIFQEDYEYLARIFFKKGQIILRLGELGREVGNVFLGGDFSKGIDGALEKQQENFQELEFLGKRLKKELDQNRTGLSNLIKFRGSYVAKPKHKGSISTHFV